MFNEFERDQCIRQMRFRKCDTIGALRIESSL